MFKPAAVLLIATVPSTFSQLMSTPAVRAATVVKPAKKTIQSPDTATLTRNPASVADEVSAEDLFIQNLYQQTLQFLKNRNWDQVPIRSDKELDADVSEKMKEPGIGAPINIEGALKLCQRGVAHGCLLSAFFTSEMKYKVLAHYRSPEFGGPAIPEIDSQIEHLNLKAKALFAAACIQGAGMGCDNSFELFPKGEEREELESLSENLCDQGSQPYCHSLERELGYPNLKHPDDICPESECSASEVADRTRLLQKVAFVNCQAGDNFSCRRLVNDSTLPEDDPSVAKAVGLLDAKCAGGETADSESSYSDPCSDLAAIAKQKGDKRTAVAYSIQSCNQGKADSCLRAVNMASVMDGADNDSLLQLLVTYCRTKSSNGK